MLIAPTEPDSLKATGKVTLLPEKYGVDILWANKGQWIGVQRKEISDLTNSIHDGRLQREVAQMQRLHQAILVVEGKVQWTLDGILLGKGFGGNWTRRQHRGLLWSIKRKGVWVETTETTQGTIELITDLQAWFAKNKHLALDRRPGPVSIWGTPDHKDFGCHLLMGIPDIGPELAARIYEHFQGVPWAWTVTKEQLMEVKGVGKKKAEVMMKALGTVNTI